MLRTLRTLSILGLVAGAVLLAGCRGMQSEREPIHPNLNMDFQQKFQAQEANPFFADGAAMRKPVSGTVARGMLKDDTRFFQGRTESGDYVGEIPMAVTRELLERGQERYNIYCSVCHGKSGNGKGVIMIGNDGQGYGYTPATSYHSERIRGVSDGYLYDVVTNGVRNMPGYAQQIAVADRWAIVSYVRALQRSQNAREEDLPPSIRAEVQQGRSANMEGRRSGTGADPTGASSSGSSGASTGGASTGGASAGTSEQPQP